MPLALVVLVALLVAGCSSSGSASSSTSSTPATSAGSNSGSSVTLKSLMFMPEVLTIKVGTKVTWRNDEPITHTVTSGRVTGLDKTSGLRTGQQPDGVFNARLKGKGDTFSHTFTAPGTYSYYCDIHFGMNAKVVVTP
jgi:plastocyanin